MMIQTNTKDTTVAMPCINCLKLKYKRNLLRIHFCASSSFLLSKNPTLNIGSLTKVHRFCWSILLVLSQFCLCSSTLSSVIAISLQSYSGQLVYRLHIGWRSRLCISSRPRHLMFWHIMHYQKWKSKRWSCLYTVFKSNKTGKPTVRTNKTWWSNTATVWFHLIALYSFSLHLDDFSAHRSDSAHHRRYV